MTAKSSSTSFFGSFADEKGSGTALRGHSRFASAGRGNDLHLASAGGDFFRGGPGNRFARRRKRRHESGGPDQGGAIDSDDGGPRGFNDLSAVGKPAE